jgi:hypothetical protein
MEVIMTQLNFEGNNSTGIDHTQEKKGFVRGYEGQSLPPENSPFKSPLTLKFAPPGIESSNSICVNTALTGVRTRLGGVEEGQRDLGQGFRVAQPPHMPAATAGGGVNFQAMIQT